MHVLQAFIDHISVRESENFFLRRGSNKDSVTLTTIHQSKGLEWDTVFIIKANESEIPLLHEYNGSVTGNGTSLEEERRLLYVAMTRARKKLFFLYLVMDSNWQMLQPSRFLREIPGHLLEMQADLMTDSVQTKNQCITAEVAQSTASPRENLVNVQTTECPNVSTLPIEPHHDNSFLKRFAVEERAVISHLFHQWAKKKAFQDPKRLLDKVGFIIDERLRVNNKQKEVLNALKSCLRCDEAFNYAEHDLTSGRMISSAEERHGLYYLSVVDFPLGFEMGKSSC